MTQLEPCHDWHSGIHLYLVLTQHSYQWARAPSNTFAGLSSARDIGAIQTIRILLGSFSKKNICPSYSQTNY